MQTHPEDLNYETQRHLLHLKDVFGAMDDELDKREPEFIIGLFHAATALCDRAIEASEQLEKELRKCEVTRKADK